MDQVGLPLYDLTGDGVLAVDTPEKDEQSGRHRSCWAYVGEVVVRTTGGAWNLRDRPDGGIRATLTYVGIEMTPVETV